MTREFFDTAETALNAESGYTTYWSNLGYWRRCDRYPEAAEALARLLADAAALSASDNVLDMGFGMGEQLRLWHRAYGVQRLAGINPSASQNAVARERAGTAGFRLLQAGVEDALPLPQAEAFDKALALDCAYHFTPRRQVFGAVASSLRPHGVLALTDLYLPRSLRPAESLALRSMCRLSRIPFDNLLSQDAYQRQLAEAGFEVARFIDITADVFAPFARWWQSVGRHQRMPLRDRPKFAITAAVLAGMARRGALAYVLVKARRQSSG